MPALKWMFRSDVFFHKGSYMPGKYADLINTALRIAHLIQRISCWVLRGSGHWEVLWSHDITLEQKSHSRQGHARDGSLTMFHRERSFRDDQLSCFLWEILFPSNLKMLMINIAKRQWGQHLSKATQEHLQTEESSFLYNRTEQKQSLETLEICQRQYSSVG